MLDHPEAESFVVYITSTMPVIQAVNPEVPNPFPTAKPTSMPRLKRSAIIINMEIEPFDTLAKLMNSLGDVSKNCHF